MHKFLALLAVAGFVSAQSLQGLPSCAISCVGSSLPADCNADPTCICKSAGFISGISCCVSTACNEADQQATLEYAKGICAPAGVTNLPTSAGCSSTATGSSSGSATSGASSATGSAASAASSAVSSASAAASSAASSASAAASSAGGAASSAASSVEAAATSAAAAATSAAAGDNAGSKVVAQFGAVGAGLLGVAALL